MYIHAYTRICACVDVQINFLLLISSLDEFKPADFSPRSADDKRLGITKNNEDYIID
jgi:hypothetical protein